MAKFTLIMIYRHSQSLLFLFLTLVGTSLSIKAQDYRFIENKGQWDNRVRYKAEINGGDVYFESNGLHYQFIKYPFTHAHHSDEEHHEDHEHEFIEGHNFNVEFINSNENAEIRPNKKSNYYFNYFLGKDESEWQSYVHSFSSIKYEEIYNGVDLEYFQSNGLIKYNFIVKQGFSPHQIKLKYNGVKRPKIVNEELVVEHTLGELIEGKPIAFQIIKGDSINIKCNYSFDKEKNIVFDLPNGYHPDYELIIDPLIFSTYSGSRSGNFGASATYDTLGFAYMGGTVFANAYNNTVGGFQSTYQSGDADIAISKFSPDGSQLIYSTFLGGSETDVVSSMVVDSDLNLIVLGTTSSIDYPTLSYSYDSTKEFTNQTISLSSGYGWAFGNGSDIVITKFNRAGSNILGSTYLGGNGFDGINYNTAMSNSNFSNIGLIYNYGDHFRGEVIVDKDDNIYVGSSTTSSNLVNAINSNSGLQDGLVAKFNDSLSQVLWLRYFGGNQYDAVNSLKIIDSNKVLIGGGSNSDSNFPIDNQAYQTNRAGGRADGFVSIISANGQTVLNNTFIGTTSYDQVYFIDFDRFGNIYALGQTASPQTFPILNTSVHDVSGQFVVKLDPNLDSLLFSHTFGDDNDGGNINISPTAFLVDRCFNIYVSGWGGSLYTPDLEGSKILPLTMRLANNSTLQSTTDGNDQYIYVVNGNLDSVLFASFIGDPGAQDHVDGGTSRFNKDGIIYQSVCASCGVSGPGNFPTTPGSFSPSKNVNVGSNNCNNALFKYDFQILPIANFSSDSSEFCLGANDTVAITITDRSVRADKIIWDFYGTRVESNFSDTTIFITQPGQYAISQIVEDTICATGDITSLLINARPDNLSLDLTQDTLLCYSDSLIIQSNATNTNLLTWATDKNFSNVLQSSSLLSYNAKLQNGFNTFYVMAQNTLTNACELIDSITINYYPTSFNSQVSKDTICQGEEISFNASATNIDKFIWDFGNGTFDSTNFNSNLIYNTSGNYNIKFIIQSDSCPIRDTTNYSLNVQANALVLNTIPDSLYCGTDTVKLSINANGTMVDYLWSSNNQFSDTLNLSANENSLEFFSNTNTRLYYKISDLYCARQDSTNIRYIEYDVNLADVIDSVCSPATIQLNSTQIGVDNYSFDFGNGSSNTSNLNPTVNYNDSGTYIIRLITNNTTCLRSDTLYDTLRIEPEVKLIPIADTMICIGDTIALDIDAQGVADQYTWSLNSSFIGNINPNNSSNINISPSANTTYFYKARNSICEADSSVNVEVQILDVFVDDFTSICLDDTISIQADELSNFNPSYVWEPKDSIIGSNTNNIIHIAPKQNIFYFLESESALGCVDKDTVEVEVNIPAFDSVDIFLSSDTIFRGQSIQLFTNRNGSHLSYFWESTAGVDNPNAANPSSSPIISSEYKVTVFDNNTNCEVVAFKRIVVLEINCNEPEIFIPSAFTPNGDGKNDILYVRGNILKYIELQIFNRWGELVFESNDPNIGWDGTHQSKALDPGVFVYHLKAICFDEQEFEKKGNITLIR